MGYERHAVGQWFRCYREKGLEACLRIDPGDHKRDSAIRGKALEELRQRLSSPTGCFTSYRQIHQWLLEEHQIHLSYEHVHRFFVTAPHVDTLYFEYLLTEFSGHEPQVFKVIFLDRAGYHKARELRVPENIRLVFLPSSNPEVNPVERLWEDMKGKVAFNNFRDEEELEQWIESTARGYSSEQIASLTGYPYIKKAVAQAKKAME